MRISEQEAEKLYPTKYHLLESFNATTDDLQEAYIQGREAPPCKEQIEAVALSTMANESEVEFDSFGQIRDYWNNLTEKERNKLWTIATQALIASINAVMNDDYGC